MPSYYDVWKKRMLNNGGSPSEAILNNSKKIYANNFKNDPSYRKGTLKKSDLTEHDIDTRIINIDKTIKEKRIQILPDGICNMGDYIIYPNKTYIITEFEDNVTVPYCKVTKCNQNLTQLGWNMTVPCYVTNDAYGNKLLLDSDILSSSDEKCKITVQNNEITRNIKKNARFMFAHSPHGIFKIFSIDVVYNEGLINFICKKDLYRKDIDDLENNIAGQVDEVDEEIPPLTYEIVGSDTIKINTIEQYNIKSDSTIRWSVDDSSICTMIEQGSKYCTLKALKKDEQCVLTAKINNTVVGEKLIITTR